MKHSYAAEAEQRWGSTRAFQESQRRASTYRPGDWTRIQAEAADIERRLAAAMLSRWPADSDLACDLAEEHRAHLSRWFYACDLDLHRMLADMYVEDERFTQHYEDIAPGLARYLADAIHANADRRQ